MRRRPRLRPRPPGLRRQPGVLPLRADRTNINPTGPAPETDRGRPVRGEGRPMNVEHILARKGREVRTIEPTASLGDALQRLRAERIGALVVSESGADLLGILSDRDILDAIADHGTAVLGESVGGAMT